MTAANRKYQQLKRKVQAWNAVDHQRDKELQSDKYPNCRGLFDDCPSEEDFNQALKDKIVLRKCRICPNYHDK